MINSIFLIAPERERTSKLASQFTVAATPPWFRTHKGQQLRIVRRRGKERHCAEEAVELSIYLSLEQW